MAEVEEVDVYCLCRRPYQDAEFMIECDICKDWFHGSCVGIEEHQSTDIDKYHCPNCQPEHGPLTIKRRRNWHRHDYSEINDEEKAIQSGTVMFVKNLKKRKFPKADGEVLFHVKGSEVTVDYFEQNGFLHPLIVDKKDDLGIKVPHREYAIADVEKCVGSMRELDVIDVSRQEDLKMKMREWTEYYEDPESRPKVLNVISLEFTGTDLAKLVSPPSVVKKIDWINNHWPEVLPEDCLLSRPMVQKYCLMGVKDSYTDFHVDFGGTSVWYHIVRGEKVFYLIPPTEENLIRYEEWVMSSNQSEVFFGDMVPKCYKATIKEGNTLFIPTGWIHAVLTPLDSLVFGGNFLHRFGIRMQLRIYDIELRLETPLKFRHPFYEALTWFAAKNYLEELNECLERGTAPPSYLVDGLKEMAYNFNEWTRTKEGVKVHGNQIPPDFQPKMLLEQLYDVLERAKWMNKNVHSKLVPDRSKRKRHAGSLNGRKKAHTPPSSEEEAEEEEEDEEESEDDEESWAESAEERLKPPEKKKPITMKLSTSERRVIRRSDRADKKVSLRLSVPEAKVMSSSLEEEERRGVTKERLSSSGSEGSLRINDETTPSSASSWYKSTAPSSRYRDKSREFKDGDYIYPHLVDETESSKPGRTRKGSSEDYDILWKPQGSIQLMKGSIASSYREKRNAKKRSFEQSMSATAAKILKMEHERGENRKKEKNELTPPPHEVTRNSRQTDPILGGGALKVEIGGDGTGGGGDGEERMQRARAAAAANAVDAVLAASRPKSKLLTPKQRLGKILGLGKGPRRKT